MGFDFSVSQREEQQLFFKHLHDRMIARNDVDLYKADIVAICKLIDTKRRSFLSFFFSLVPDRCSTLFQQLIESLFITHAELKLNELGHLAEDRIDPIQALRGSWCANLTRRPSPVANS